MEYNVLEHGDTLEKIASDFIKSLFPNYEEVWKNYIGNKGDNTKADIPNYPNDNKRKNFSEYSYTVLESAFIIYSIVQSKVFMKPISKIDEYIEFNKSFISFFAHIGRINDNVINASNEISKNYVPKLQADLKHLYEARHIVIHGKVVPIAQDEFGLVQIPKFYTGAGNTYDWTFNKSWNEAVLATEMYAEDVVQGYYNQLIFIINNAYGHFGDVIMGELKAISTTISFEYDKNRQTPINPYNIILPGSSSCAGF